MITTLIVSFILATIIIGINPGNLSLRWLSASLYTASLMIAVFIIDLKYPVVPNFLINTLFFITDIALAYTFGMFGVVYSDLLNRKNRTRIMLVGFFLIGVVWMLTPLTPTRRINYEGYNELPVVIFIVIALSLGIVFLIIANIIEKHPYKKVERSLTTLLIVPIMLSIAGCYIFYVFEIDLFQFNYMLATVILILFVVLGMKKGALGVKIKIEMMKSDASIQLLKSGTSLLNHTIKNEIGKVDILLHQIRHTFQAKEAPRETVDVELKEMLTMATDSVHHIQAMMTKINEQVQVIVVELKKENILPVLEQSLEAIEKSIKQDTTIIRKLEPVQAVYHDPVHMKEVIMNILSNAVESVEAGGVITVSLSETETQIVLRIEDSGKGIPKEDLPLVFEPFYTTKKIKNHYGLGLYYSKNVIRSHNGSIYVDSTLGKGACFYIHLRK